MIKHFFGTMKRIYGFLRNRYIELDKVHDEVVLKAMAYNLKQAIRYRPMLFCDFGISVFKNGKKT